MAERPIRECPIPSCQRNSVSVTSTVMVEKYQAAPASIARSKSGPTSATHPAPGAARCQITTPKAAANKKVTAQIARIKVPRWVWRYGMDASVQLGPGLLDHIGPLGELVLDQRAELLGRAAGGLVADHAEA